MISDEEVVRFHWFGRHAYFCIDVDDGIAIELVPDVQAAYDGDLFYRRLKRIGWIRIGVLLTVCLLAASLGFLGAHVAEHGHRGPFPLDHGGLVRVGVV